MKKGVFDKLVIALDIGYDLDFKKKSWLRKSIVENGGTISYIVNKKCNFVIISDPEKCSSSNKCRMATKYRIPVLSMDYIWNCIGSGELQLNDPYVVGGGCQLLDFKQGKISALKPTEKTKKTKFVFNPRSVKALSPGHTGLPPFDEDRCVVAKYAIYEGLISNQKTEKLFVIEIQVLPPSPIKDEEKDQDSTTVTEGQYQCRVVQQIGPKASLETSNIENQEIRPTQTADQALSVFAMLCEDLEKHPKVSKCTEPVRGVGSTQLQKLMVQTPNILETCNEDVKDLVEHIWSEAMSEITFWLGDITQIKVEQVEKAEAVLLKLRDALRDSAPIEDLVKTFYATLPYKVKEPPSDKELRLWLGKQQDICQLIKDLISVNEMTNFEKRLYVEAKYAALRCGIKKSDKSEQIETLVQQSVCEGFELDVVNVYEVWRQTEDLNFRHDLDNKQLLFHSSRVENFVGILSRGLLLPKIVVDDYGGKRSDVGLLGSGIYFASRASTSAKYSTPSKTKGTRLLLVNEVALGKCEPCYHHNLTLTSAPYPYNSTHGIGKEYDDTTAFTEDQYAIYDTTQQRLCYLVEFTLKGDRVKGLEVISEPPTDVAMEEDMDHADLNLNDVTDIDDPMSKVKPGLIGGGRGMVELQGVHIRAKIVDLATQVVVLQKYVNNGDSPIEAKYVFPLDDAGAVCGFEAFINGKHIVGEVKEKETAHKEYKKAISEGHGAYLMDQDEETPDVFTVSVGNLPPKASVLIKITYVAEVQVEGELISFRLPATVAPWKESSALKETTQEELSSHKVSSGQTSVQVAIEMPFDIKSLECPSHFVNIKQTASKAFVEMLDGEEFGTGFHLLIGLAEIHVPRMWVENLPDDPYRQACMLTFHPEFEASAMEEGEIILVLDCSNSMKGAALVEAKKVALLLLKEIPSQWSFNVLKFGSDFEELFPAPKVKTDQTVDKAWHFIQNAAATLGNTDASRPFHSFFLLPKTDDTLRNVFLVSDGHINNTDLLLRNGSKNATHTRVFTFGVSSTCNSYFLKALARVSGGAFEFFNKAIKSKWEPKVKGQIQKASQPGLTSVSVEWVQYDDNLPAPDQAPRQITALFNGFRQVVYGFVANCTMAKLTAKIGGQEVSTVVSTSELSITEGMIVHRLTARAMIRDWEDGMLSSDRTNHEVAKMDLKNFVIDLSTDYSIVTQFTSFIAVEKREENEKDETPSGPSMDELVEAEDVDMLDYMGWTKEPDASELPIHILMSEWFKYRDNLSVMETKFLALLDGQQVLNQEVIEEYAETLVSLCHLNEENQEELADKVCAEIDKNLPEMSSQMRFIMYQPVALDGGWGDDSDDDDDDFYNDDDDKIEMEEEEGDLDRDAYEDGEEDEDFGSCLFDDSCAERRRDDGDEVVISMDLMDADDDMFHDVSYAISKRLGDSSGDDSAEMMLELEALLSSKPKMDEDPPPPYRKSRRRRGAAAVQEPMMEALEESKFSSPTKFYNDADDNDADYGGGDDDGDLDDDADEEYEEHEDLGYCLLDSISATATPQPAYAHATGAVEIHSDDTKTKSLSKAGGKKDKRDDESNFTLAHFKRKPKAIQTGAEALAKTKPNRVFYKADLIDNAMDDDDGEAPDSPLERSACSFMVEDELNITTLDSRFTSSSELRQSRLFGNVLSVQEKDKKSLLPQISTQPVAGKRGGRSSSRSAVTGKIPPPPPHTGGLFGSDHPPPPPSTGGLFGSAQPPPPAPGALFGSAQGFSFGGPSPRAQRFGSAQPQGFSLGGPMTRAQRFGSPQVQGQDTFGSPIQPQHGIPLRHYMGGAPINPFASPLAAKAGGFLGSSQPQQDDLFGSSGALQANPFASPPRGGGRGGKGGGGGGGEEEEGRELFRAKGKQSMEGKPFGTSTGPFVSSQQPLLSPEAERACRFDDEKNYSPTSPSYSPTSPSYSPTSPSLLMDSPLMPTGPAPPLQLCKAMPPPPPSQAPPPQKYIAPPLRHSMIQQAALSLPGDKLKSTKSSPMEKKVERDELRRQIAMAECRFTSREHLQLQQEQLKKIPLSKGQRRRSQESDRCLSSSLMSPDTSQTYDIQETVLELQPTSQALCSFSRPWLPLPSRKKKRSLKGMDRLTAADCEIEFEEDLSPLACFGIGSKLVCVRKGEQRLKLERLSRLLECQADTGYWELSPQLGDLIGIDSAACIKMLEDSGIKSLGRTAIIALHRLLATVLALISIIEIVFPEMIPISKSNILDRLKNDGDEYDPLTLQLSRLAEKGMSPEREGPLDLVEGVKKAYTFCTATDEEYPLAYSTLELGPDWLTVCASMLKVPVKH